MVFSSGLWYKAVSFLRVFFSACISSWLSSVKCARVLKIRPPSDFTCIRTQSTTETRNSPRNFQRVRFSRYKRVDFYECCVRFYFHHKKSCKNVATDIKYKVISLVLQSFTRILLVRWSLSHSPPASPTTQPITQEDHYLNHRSCKHKRLVPERAELAYQRERKPILFVWFTLLQVKKKTYLCL